LFIGIIVLQKEVLKLPVVETFRGFDLNNEKDA
jgi:hypothetical protein